MKTILKVAVLSTCFVLMLLIDAPPQVPFPGLQLVPEAHAVLGTRRRTARRTAVVVSSADAKQDAQAQQQTAAAQQQAAASKQEADAAKKQAAAAEQEAAAAKQQAAAAEQEAAAAKQQAAAAQQQAAAPPPPPPAAGGALPLGTVVSALPPGCAPMTSGGVEYYKCGANYYRAVFQGNNLVYVTAKP
jgi:hypothetical protein